MLTTDSISTRSLPTLVGMQVLDRSANRLHWELTPAALFKKLGFINDRKEFKNFCCNINSKFLQDGRSLFKKITELQVRITDAQSAISEQRHNFRSIRRVLSDVEQALSHYHIYEMERMQELIKLELNLWQECTTLAERLDLWGNYSSQMHRSAGRICSHDFDLITKKNMLPEVFAFQNYLAKNGGRTGGWSDFDHKVFLNIRRRYNCKHTIYLDSFAEWILPDELKDKFAQEVVSVLCLTSKSEAIAHEEWFSKLQQLEAASKRALRKCRSWQAGALPARLSFERNPVTKTRLQSAPPLDRQHQRGRGDLRRETKHRQTRWRLKEEQKAKEERRLSENWKPQKGIVMLEDKN